MGALRTVLIFVVIAIAVGYGCGNDSDEGEVVPTLTTPQATAESTITPTFSSAAPTPSLETTSVTGASTETVTPDATSTTTQPPSPTAPPTAPATTFDPAVTGIALESVGSGFSEPLFVTHAGDGSGRIFVVERVGIIRLLDGTVFLDLSDRVGSASTEQGLLGLAFHPDYEANGYLYVNYTNLDGDTRIARFATGADGLPDPASELVLIAQDQPAANHNGGMVAFGPDGYLYIGLGDGGGANNEFGNGQNLETLLGTLLRIDVNTGDPYGIPADNPFLNTPGARPEIWAYGLRNPWRFSFDAATGDLFIADVGQNSYEEINWQPGASTGGENYGWPAMEGMHCVTDGCDPAGFVMPVAEYDRDGGCSVTGGYIYRGAAFPALTGAYLFGDYCTGRIWSLHQDAAATWQTTELLQADARISSFGTDEANEMYLTDLSSGTIYRVVAE